MIDYNGLLKVIADAEDAKESADSILWRIKYHLNHGNQPVAMTAPGTFRYTITTPRLANGKYRIPKHKNIPEKLWGIEVSDRIIQFNK